MFILKCTEDVNKKRNFPLIYRASDEDSHDSKLLKCISLKSSMSDVTAINLSADVPLVTRFFRCACTHIEIMKRNIVPKWILENWCVNIPQSQPGTFFPNRAKMPILKITDNLLLQHTLRVILRLLSRIKGFYLKKVKILKFWKWSFYFKANFPNTFVITINFNNDIWVL